MKLNCKCGKPLTIDLYKVPTPHYHEPKYIEFFEKNIIRTYR